MLSMMSHDLKCWIFPIAGLLLFHPSSFILHSSVAAEPSTLERIRKEGVLTVALDPDNLPYSHSKKTPRGFDIEMSELLAKEMGVSVKYSWVDTVRETPLGELLEKQCDCAVGTAIEKNTAGELSNLGEKVLFTKPYYSTGYVLVVKEGGPQPGKLEELKGKKIGAEAGSVADYQLNLKGHNRRLYPRQEAIFNGLQTGEVIAGFMWAPTAGWLLKNDPVLKLHLVKGYAPEPGYRWNVGLAVRQEDKDLKETLDQAIQKLVESQQIQKIFTRYGVPYFPPFK